MPLFSLLAVLLLEQLWPLPRRRWVHSSLSRFADFLERRCNAGERRSGVFAWLIGVGGLVLVSAGVHFLLVDLSPLLAWLYDVAVLYVTMGFRQSSQRYADIQLALRRGDSQRARQLLGEWRGRPGGATSASEIARLAIEEALCASHRRLFGVFACFLLFPGPSGAVLYRVSSFLARAWGQCDEAEEGDFGSFARRTFAIIDWLPVRLTAASFAIVGNFEDAVYCWRMQAGKWRADGLGIVLASGAGALGVRLGVPAASAAQRNEIGTAEEADVDFMESAFGLVWRALMLWLLLLLLLGLANLVGG